MHKTARTVVAMIILVAVVAIAAVTASAFAPGFSVTPVIPENQNPDNTSFFDLNVTAGTTQDLSVTITNPSDADATFEASLLAVGTNRNGVVDYTSPGLIDETIQYPFPEIAYFPEGNIITVPAGQSVVFPIHANIPEGGFDGQVLGAIRLLLGITDEERAEAGMIVSRFAYITIVRMHENDTIFVPDFLLGDVGADTVNHRAAFVAELRNPMPRISLGTTINAQLYQDGQLEPFWTIENISADFAPNSIFELTFMDYEGFGIHPGDYRVRIQLEMDGQLWEFERTFNVAAMQSLAINSAAVNQQQITMSEQQVPLAGSAEQMNWTIIAIAIGAALILAIAILIILLSKKSRRRGDVLLELNKRSAQ